MRSWAKTVVGCRCGRCGEPIPEGAAAELVELRDMKRQLIRCERCALTPKPLVMPVGRTTKAMTPLRLSLPAQFRRDGKALAVND